jgi:hypothetical protein
VYRGMPGAVVTFLNIPKIKKAFFVKKLGSSAPWVGKNSLVSLK